MAQKLLQVPRPFILTTVSSRKTPTSRRPFKDCAKLDYTALARQTECDIKYGKHTDQVGGSLRCDKSDYIISKVGILDDYL